MLTEQEVNKIFYWKPYRDSWPIDRNQANDNIENYYGELIKEFTKNNSFEAHYSQNGGLSNYLEFICYPKGSDFYQGNALMVCVSLCAPIATYGQTTFTKKPNVIGYAGLFSANEIENITDKSLLGIEHLIKSILLKHNLLLINKEFAGKQLPNKVIEELKDENHNEGKQYLQGIFQITD